MSNSQTKAQEYLDHATGLTSFILWLSEMERTGVYFRAEDSLIHLSEMTAMRFCIGVPTHRVFGKYPFVSVQEREARFMRLLRFNRAHIVSGTRKLILACDSLKGDGDSYPDLPPFGICIPFDAMEKIETLSMSDHLEAKSLWFDDIGKARIGNKDVFWTIPLEKVAPGTPHFQDNVEEFHSASSIIEKARKLAREKNSK